ncbi:hypothetical protein L1987_15998 [Smallanthus sonchifolius]|uniref:Uncharacterized protein n=1 Tax=Smallanthus sonchifolius TaxID=185202 RepID=A0ACB9J9R9_9ASTR|nr:hypothetical protein L1987_15998 [Smallanthus sonchifolius]
MILGFPRACIVYDVSTPTRSHQKTPPGATVHPGTCRPLRPATELPPPPNLQHHQRSQSPRSLLRRFQAIPYRNSPSPKQSSSTLYVGNNVDGDDSAEQSSGVTHNSPTQVLKNFSKIRFLKIEHPSIELGIEDNVLLKWRADFGSTLDNCVILRASSLQLTSGENKDEVSSFSSSEQHSKVIGEKNEDEVSSRAPKSS